MAQISKIGHDFQAPFWVVLLVVLLVVQGQAVTRGKIKLPQGQFTLEPKYFYRFWRTWSLARGCRVRGSLHKY